MLRKLPKNGREFMIIGGMIFDETWIFMAFAEKEEKRRKKKEEDRMKPPQTVISICISRGC